MNKIEVQEKVMEALNLKVGDKIKLNNSEYIIVKDSCGFYLKTELGFTSYYTIGSLINYGFEKIKPKKKLGDTKCVDYFCLHCPLYSLNCKSNTENKLFGVLECTKIKTNMSEAIYEAYKSMLNKEIEDESN